MSSKDGLQIPELNQWLKWLEKLEAKDVDRMKGRVLRSIGLRGLEVTQDNTPRKTSRLAGSMSMGDKDNLFKVSVGKTSYVFYGTAVSYAAAVNDGHQQERGRFVPGFWQGDTFHYQPGYDKGMILTGKIIEGAHMFEKGIQALEAGDVDRIVEFEFRRLYAELFRG